jgi:crossover junction endodeoxyribonuclease RuvC
MAQEITILGVDPGLKQTGLGLIAVDGRKIRLCDAAVLATNPAERLPLRLCRLFIGMQEALRTWKPHLMVVEKLIYARNAQVALKLGHARGVLLLVAEQLSVPIAEYTPAEIKRAVTGRGAASKEQVHRMVKAIVRSSDFSSPFDVTDALALAICHAHRVSQRPELLAAVARRTTFLARA